MTYDGGTGILNIPAFAVDGSTYLNVTLINTGGWTFSLQTATALVSIVVRAATISPKEGDTVQMAAEARDPAGNLIPNANVTWSISDPSLASITTTGLLQTFATGTVAVTATINGISGTQSLTITPILVSVTLGAKEVVFDYSTDHCADLDVPDQPARFVRAEDGSLVLFDGDAPTYCVSRGTGFGSLTRDYSQPALVSANFSTAE